MPTLSEVRSMIFALPVQDRMVIAREVWDVEFDDEEDRALCIEAQRREARLANGESKGVKMDDLLHRLENTKLCKS